ncbi:hypothetical protein AGMMS49525_17840 [Bacteroidia bacterium]|nr:hypothetical protein AGMMS49525_17840 [Bacteroidia bacterium]
MPVKSGGKWGYINLEGEYVIKPKFEEAQSFQDGLALVKSGGKWGYINLEGEYAIAPQFKEANSFHEDLARVKSVGGKVGYIGKDGKYVIAANYQDGSDFFGEQAFVLSASGAVVCIDKTGNAKFTLGQAKYVWGYSAGLTMFLTAGGKIKYVNKSGKVVFEENCDYNGASNGICCVLGAGSLNDGILSISQDGKYSFIDKTGGFISSTKFDYVSDFSEGLAAVRVKNGKWGFIDKTGKVVISPQFEVAHNFSEGLAGVVATSPNRKYYYIDKTGKVVNSPQKTDKVATKYSEGLAKSKSSNKWGFIDKAGKFVIRPEYDDALDFSEGLAAVKLNGKWGYININQYGVAIEPQFSVAGSFHNGLAEVMSSDDRYDDSVMSLFIDKRGKIIGKMEIEQEIDIRYLPNGITVVFDNGYNLVSAAGTIATVDDIKYLSSAKDYYGNGMDYADWDYFFSVGNGKLENTYISGLQCQ